MSIPFLILTVAFIIVSAVMVLIILVQRPQGGGLAGAFGGASGGGTDTVFGGRVGDALTMMTIAAFGAYLLMAIGLNMMDPKPSVVAATQPAAATQPTITPVAAPPGAPTPSTATRPTIQVPSVPPATEPASILNTPESDDSPMTNPGTPAPPTTAPGSGGE